MIDNQQYIAARSAHPGGVNAVLGDGALRWISNYIDLSVWQAICTSRGGERRRCRSEYEPSPPLSSAAFIGVLVILVGGCSRGPNYRMANVSGTITIDGKPVPKGYVTFSPTAAAAGPAVGSPIADGRYRCEQVPLGDLRQPSLPRLPSRPRSTTW